MIHSPTDAFILRRKSYRETSYLLDIFTSDCGIVSLVFRGAKNHSNPAKSKVTDPFNLININFDRGKKTLTTLKNYELKKNYSLVDIWLYCGFYINELVLKLLGKYDAYQHLFAHYHYLIAAFEDKPNATLTQIFLRHFEIQILKTAGFGMDFKYDYKRQKIQKNHFYELDFDYGFIPTNSKNSFSGEVLMALHSLAFKELQNIQTIEVRDYQNQLGKMLVLMRKIINHALMGKKIESRKLLSEYLKL